MSRSSESPAAEIYYDRFSTDAPKLLVDQSYVHNVNMTRAVPVTSTLVQARHHLGAGRFIRKLIRINQSNRTAMMLVFLASVIYFAKGCLVVRFDLSRPGSGCSETL